MALLKLPLSYSMLGTGLGVYSLGTGARDGDGLSSTGAGAELLTIEGLTISEVLNRGEGLYTGASLEIFEALDMLE